MKRSIFRRSLLILALLIEAPTLHAAARFEVVGNTPMFSVDASLTPGQTVAKLTRSLLERARETRLILDFVFNGIGVESITGPDGNLLGLYMEPVSALEWRAYGWCYSVDGVAPDVLADEFNLKGSESIIRWFYGYASRIEGHWQTQCTPVFRP